MFICKILMHDMYIVYMRDARLVQSTSSDMLHNNKVIILVYAPPTGDSPSLAMGAVGSFKFPVQRIFSSVYVVHLNGAAVTCTPDVIIDPV